LMMSLWDALRMNMMISYQELVRTFLSLMEGYFEVVKVDRCFFNEQVQNPTLYPLIASIQKHCDKIIIEGIENREHMGLLREVGIWGLQGYLFKSVPFKNVDSLL
ncbi:hypothetical protein M8S23_22475, partial [Enterobacter roggenkampii]|nr:hypothetical protein [Enterobacter roggenkampii]MCM7725836.1 hypothetical protein [Enterobacter roggenkampii]